MTNVYKPGLLQIRPQYDSDVDAPDKPENVLWFVSGSAVTPTLSDLTNIASRFDADWYNLWVTVGAAGKHYTGSIITDWSSATGLTYSSVGTFPPGIGGQGTQLPAQVSVLISLHVALRFKGGHFRVYLPWIGASALDASDKNKLIAAQIAAATTQVANVFSDMQASGVLGGQTWKCYKNRHNPATATLLDFPSYTVQPLLATQRRRLRRAAHR